MYYLFVGEKLHIKKIIMLKNRFLSKTGK